MLSAIVPLILLQKDLDQHIYPLAKPLPAPVVKIEVSDSTASKEWSEKAKLLVDTWFPILTSWLATETYKAPTELNLVFKKELRVPAYASGNTITISGKWIAEHPDDLGVVIHELTHIIQSYPASRTTPGWLVEGIADYIRWWKYEPEFLSTSRPRLDVEKAKYTDSYRTTAYWLAWVSRKYDMRLVPSLDREMRAGKDPMPVFEKLTKKTPDSLWDEFIKSRN